MLLDLMLRIKELPARQATAAGAIDLIRGSERQGAFVSVMMARTARDRATALGSARAGTITRNWLTSVVRALGITFITGAAIFFAVVLLSIYGGLPLFFA